MKRFSLNIFVFAVFILIADLVCGYAFDIIKAQSCGGDTYKSYYLAEKCKDDIIILGSSRAARHFVPEIIEDSLRLTCYNGGQQGCGIIPGYARYKMLLERYTPKLVIYEVFPEFDYLAYDDYSKYIGSIRQFQNHKSVKETYDLMNIRYEKVKSLSNMYKNNSCFIGNIRDIVISNSDKGFIPLHGEINENIRHQDDKDIFPVDMCLATLFERLLSESRNDGVSLVLMISPKYKADNSEFIKKYNLAYELASKYDIPIIDCTNLRGISGKKEFFSDYMHLNEIGAQEFTKRIISIIKPLVLQTEK